MDEIARITISPGTYSLVMSLDRARTITIGKLGTFLFQPRTFIYVGSAHGPGGLRARLKRHIQAGGRIHWHVDYLRGVADLAAVIWTTDPSVQECDWRAEVHSLPGASIPVPGFGASDCRSGCPAHLVSLPKRTPPKAWTTTLLTSLSGNPDGHALIMG